MTRLSALTIVIIVTAGLAGAVIGRLLSVSNLSFSDFLISQNGQELYITTDSQLRTQLDSTVFTPLGWADLLPNKEREVIKKYQPARPQSLEDKVFNAIEAAQDKDYQASRVSTAQVTVLDGRAVTLNGFIVPLEVDTRRKVTRFFLVPYFGACLHFPPPAPNQMVYVISKGGLSLGEINNAYSVSGILHNAMYEDPLGTAAYVMDAVTITGFEGLPDDLRDHPTQD